MTTKRLQKLSRILRKIDDYDRYLHTHYTAHEVLEAYERGEKKKTYYGGCDGLIYVIWSGADDEIMADKIMEEDRL